jgi:hypothetical protein
MDPGYDICRNSVNGKFLILMWAGPHLASGSGELLVFKTKASIPAEKHC